MAILANINLRLPLAAAAKLEAQTEARGISASELAREIMLRALAAAK